MFCTNVLVVWITQHTMYWYLLYSRMCWLIYTWLTISNRSFLYPIGSSCDRIHIIVGVLLKTVKSIRSYVFQCSSWLYYMRSCSSWKERLPYNFFFTLYKWTCKLSKEVIFYDIYTMYIFFISSVFMLFIFHYPYQSCFAIYWLYLICIYYFNGD